MANRFKLLRRWDGEEWTEEERIQALVESQTGFDSSAGVDTGGPHQAWQQRPADDGAVKQWTEERNLR